MSERRDESVTATAEEIVTVNHEGLVPQAVTVDCGEYGTIMFNVAIGGEFHLKVGTKAPRFLFNDVETDIFSGENVCPIREPD